MITQLAFDKDLVSQALNIGSQNIQRCFKMHYGDLFDQTAPNISGFDIPELYEPLIIEQHKKVIGFSLPSTLISQEALDYRLLDLPTEIIDYAHELGPEKIATSLCSWIDPKLDHRTQLCVANIFQTHLHNLMKKSPAEIILCAALDYNPTGITFDDIMNKKNGFIKVKQKDNDFIERHKSEDFSKEILVKGRRGVSLKGLTQSSRAKIEKFENRYQTLAENSPVAV